MQRIVHCLGIWLALFTAYASAEPIPAGAGSFKFVDTRGNADRPITVWTYRPAGFVPAGRVVFVMHGQGRNGKVYRDAWIEYSEQQKFLLLTPEFSNDNYPSDAKYQQGYIQAFDGSIRPKEKWSLLAIEHLFDYVVQENALLTKRYTIYGHSGGGQFVHRLVLLSPEARIELAIAANPGWYTTPNLQLEYPYGLKGTPTDASAPQIGICHAACRSFGRRRHRSQPSPITSHARSHAPRRDSFRAWASLLRASQDAGGQNGSRL